MQRESKTKRNLEMPNPKSSMAEVIASRAVTKMPAPAKTEPDFEHECANNVHISVTGDKLTITVDLAQPGVVSASGKSFNVGTTSGFIRLGSPHEDVQVGLNVIRKR
jgi:hypothetical protein